MAVVLMPEAAVDENGSPISREHQIGFASKVFGMQTVAKPCRMHRFPDNQLGLRMAALDSSHIFASRLLIVNIH